MLTLPPTTLTLRDEPWWIYREISLYDQARAGRVWDEWYHRDGLRPQVEDGHLVVENQRLVEIAILLGIPQIQVRTYYYDR